MINLKTWEFAFLLALACLTGFQVGYFVCNHDWKKSLKKFNKNQKRRIK